ncbi:PLP-dependent aminotransferase family protein [Streptomyces sp. NPDC007851]|uniref:aminotransferase-like domain-containing protein n=1 Tax=Streptomyces sp. NPDC007851 TaxID=3155008 RepID=UPI0033BFE31E
MVDFRGIADRIALDIARGRLRAGQRLPPQRAFARRHGIAASTAGRVYAELGRRGLVVGEVGRGTFVRATADVPLGRALVEDEDEDGDFGAGGGAGSGEDFRAGGGGDFRGGDGRGADGGGANGRGAGGGGRGADGRGAGGDGRGADGRGAGGDGRGADGRGAGGDGRGADDRGTGGRGADGRGAGRVNLELNYPVVAGQAELLAPALAPLLRADALTAALRPAPADGTADAREAVAALLATGGWRPDPGRVLFTGNARQAIAATLASLVPPGGRVGVEPLTYPLVKEIAGRLSVTLVPVATDDEGPVVESVLAAHRSGPLRALYLQPTLHNPTSLTVSAGRRQQLARAVRDLGLPVVEDRIWSFLHGGAEPPLAALAPDQVHLVDGLSKRVAPGLTVGFAVVPRDRVTAVADAVRSGGWGAGAFALEAAVRWIADGTVVRLVGAKRAQARRRQGIVREVLDGYAVRADPGGYFAWWELPAPWRADEFTAAAAAHGIAITPGTAFRVDPKRTPDAVRLGLASTDEPELAGALRTLAALAARGPRHPLPPGRSGGPSGSGGLQAGST